MAQMIRKQIYIDADNERFLKERSSELGITEAEVVRQALAEAECRVRDQSRREALNRLLTHIREHRTFDAPRTGWKFNREELYDERLDRFGKRRETLVESSGE